MPNIGRKRGIRGTRRRAGGRHGPHRRIGHHRRLGHHHLHHGYHHRGRRSPRTYRHYKRSVARILSPKELLEGFVSIFDETDIALASLQMDSKLIKAIPESERVLDGAEQITLFTSFTNGNLMLESGAELSGTVYLNVGKSFPASRLTVSLIGVEESQMWEKIQPTSRRSSM